MFSQTTEYALRAVAWLAENAGSSQTTQEIAEGTQVPPDYLAKVLQTLARAEIVSAVRGKNGGFTLSRSPDTLSLLDIVNVVEPIRRIKTCPLGLKSHKRQLCALHSRLDQAIATVEQCLAGATFAEMIGPASRRPRCELISL